MTIPVVVFVSEVTPVAAAATTDDDSLADTEDTMPAATAAASRQASQRRLLAAHASGLVHVASASCPSRARRTRSWQAGQSRAAVVSLHGRELAASEQQRMQLSATGMAVTEGGGGSDGVATSSEFFLAGFFGFS